MNNLESYIEVTIGYWENTTTPGSDPFYPVREPVEYDNIFAAFSYVNDTCKDRRFKIVPYDKGVVIQEASDIPNTLNYAFFIAIKRRIS